MSKNTGSQPNYTLTGLGFKGLDSSPVVQQQDIKNSQAASDTLFPYQSAGKSGVISGDQNLGEYQEALNKGAQLYGSPEQIEHTLGKTQDTGEQIGSAIARFAPMTAVKLAEMVTNLGAGVKYLTTGNKDWMDPHNAWNEYLDNTSNELKQALPIHATEQYDTGNLAQHIFSSKFWTDDISDGLSFIVAQALGTKGLGIAAGTIGKGASAIAKATNLGELYNAVPITQRIATAVANKFTTGTVGFLNAAAISAMQAKGTQNQIEARLRQTYGSRINPDTGDYYTSDEVDQQLAKNKGLTDEKTSNTFWATMATELLPSIYASKLFLGAPKTEMGQLNTDIMKAVNTGKLSLEDIKNGLGEDVLLKSGWKNLTREAGKAAVVGGVAMNLQTAIQKYDVDQGVAGHSGDVWNSSLGYARQFLDNFTNNEGLKGVVMGSILGALTGAFHSGSGQYNEALKGHLDSMRASDALFGDLPKSIYQTSSDGKLILDENGNPKEDKDKLTKLTFQMLHDKNNWTNQTAAMVTANSDMATLNEHVALAQMIAKELQSGRYDTTDGAREYFKWFHGQRIKEQSLQSVKEAQDTQVADNAKAAAPDTLAGETAAVQTQSAMTTGSAAGDARISKLVNDNSQMVDTMFGLWDKSTQQANKLTRLGETSERSAFNDNIHRALYYEGVKREAMKKMLLDKEAEMRETGSNHEDLNKQTEVLQNLITDSESRTYDMLNKPDDIFKDWRKEQSTRRDLITNAIDTSTKFTQSKSEQDRRSADTADYMLQEHAAKEGLGSAGAADTDIFLTNQDQSVRTDTPVGLRNEAQYKAGLDYVKLGRLNDMIDQVRTGDIPLQEAVNYAADNISRLDTPTREKLESLIAEEKSKVTQDEQKLATIPDFDEETMTFNPEYQQLEQDIKDKNQAIEQSQAVMDKAGKAQELDMLNRSPNKIEETLNKQFAEKNFEKADNVLANALGEDGTVKDTYTDERSVNQAINQVTKMRNAIEDRITGGDLKNQEQYRYLINKADKVLEQLTKIRNAVVDNKLKRDGIQRSIADKEAKANATGIGFNLETNAVSAAPVFNAVNTVLGDKLTDMLTQVRELPSANYYEGTMSILHALKTKASAEDINTIKELMDEQVDSLLSTFPDPQAMRRYKSDLTASPELYFSDMLQALHTPGNGYEPISLEKGTPLARFNSSNDIDQLESDIQNMPDTTVELGVPKQDILNAVRAYRDIVAINRVRNLISSKIDLSKLVGNEIREATDSSGIVPTAQQEVSIRDGAAWLKDNQPVGTTKYDGWGFLRGIAGTGKTSVAVKWLLRLSELKPEEVIGTAATERAAGVLSGSIGSEAMTVDKLMEGNIPANKKLIIIDEYARIPSEQLTEFEQKVRTYNKEQSPEDRVRVMILGDPTQITPLTFANQDITRPGSNPSAKNIRAINPLTIVYRSDVSAVNEASDIFQANSKPVSDINVRADRDMNSPLAVGVHTSTSAQDISDIVRTNKKFEDDNGLTPRSRVVITENPGKYATLDIPAISVYDAQSETYDEVYVDLNPNDFNGIEKYNTAIYTALSRAREYSYLRHDNGISTIDPGLSREKENNDQVSREAKGQYIKQRAEEQAMMDAAVKGKDINQPKSEVAIKVQQQETPLEKAIEPSVPEDAEIVTEIASVPVTQVLPPAIDPEGHINPQTEDEEAPTEPIHPALLEDGEKLLPNIEKGTFEALGGRRQEQSIGKGSKVAYMYTRESNGENAITAFAFDKDGNWVPVSKIFQDELNKHPQYADWKKKVAGMQPMFTSDPQQLNAVGGRAAYALSDMAQHQVGEAEITRHQRLTYVFGNESKQNNVAQHIKDIFKTKFFSSKTTEQAKADKILFRIFRNNELQSHKFGGFTPEAGIPYAIVGSEPNSRDWSRAQFVRLTANPLSQDSEHYTTLKSYRDLAKELELKTGITPGTYDYNRTIRALKNSLKIVHEDTATGTEPRVRMREDYNRKEFIEDLKRITDRATEFIDPTEHLTEQQFEQILPKMQGLASMIYGIQETKAELTAAELEKAHGTDYEHLPLKTKQVRTTWSLKDGDVAATPVEEPLGRARLKGTGPGTGKKDVYIPDWELNSKKGSAQQAFNQLAKANEYVGNVRIRTDEYKTGKDKIARSTTATGKSLITEKGGDAKVYSSRKTLAKILGESQVQEGKLDDLDLGKKEVRTNLENDIRKLAGQENMDARDLGTKLLSESSLDDERKIQLQNELNDALNKKETPPVTMSTLDLMVGDENYNGGQHLTQEAYNVTNPKSGRTKETQTYLRTPLDIDQFNELGKSPVTNSEELSKMVGTKFQDILPTQVAVSDSNDIVSKAKEPAITEAPIVSAAPGSGRELQDRIDSIATRLVNMNPGREKLELIKEQRRLIDERDSTTRLFDESVRREDKGEKITIQQATAEIKRMLPNIPDNEINFLNKSLMIELQRPGESLLGLFQKGKLFFREDDGSVYSNIVRHEIFHKVFNDYLTDRDRGVIAKEFDPEGKMSPIDMEEALADRFMTWQREPETVTGKIKRIFQKILNWIGFSRSNGGIIDKLFNDIQDGRFRTPDPDPLNSRMAFSDVRKWGTIQDYKDASRFLQQRIYRYFIDDHIDNTPLTQGELFDALRKDLQRSFNEEDTSANSLVEGVDYLTGEYNAASSDTERQTIQSDIDVYNNELIQSNQKLKMLHTFVNDTSALKDMWKDLYPNFNFKKNGVISMTEDNPSKDDPESLDKDESDSDKIDHSLRSDFILNSDEKNQETKISQNVKNFLSFIYRPATTGKIARGESRVNPRGVYLLSLRNLSGMQTGGSDFLEQLHQRAKDNGINLSSKSDSALVVNHLINLYRNASGDAFEFNNGRDQNGNAKRYRVELPRSARFLDENTFVSDLTGKDISGITEPAESHLVISRDGRSTPEFLNELLSSNITMDQVKGYFKQFQAQETLREIISNFTSQREAIPMIAEEVNDFGRTQLRYFRAQSYGIERVQATELENSFKENWDKAVLNGWDNFEKAKPQDQNRAIADMLKHLGVDGEAVRGSDSSLVSAVYGDLQAFRKIVQQTAAEQKANMNADASDSDESVLPANPVATALENNSGMLNRLTRLLTQNSSDERASSYMDVKGTKRYLFHNGSQAHDTMARIIRHFGDKIGTLPEHLVNDPTLSKNIFASGLNKITEVLDHDGQRQEGREEFATDYSSESNKQWLERNFSYGFLSFMKSNARDNADALTYMQNFYTISNRPRMLGARVEVMSEPKIEQAVTKAIEQHVEQPDLKEVKNYDRFKAVNFDELHKAIENLHEVDVKAMAKNTEGRVELHNLYDRIAQSDEMKSALAKDIVTQLKAHAEEAMQRMKSEQVKIGNDAHEAIRLLKDKRRQILPEEAIIPEASSDTWPEDDQMRPAVESFYMNNYVNSYFLNQAVAGNMNYFKDGLDMVKRMSGIFAPGTKGIVGDKFFLKQKFNVAIAADPKMKAEYLSPIFKDTKLLEAVGKKAFDMADAQGFMLPERAANIIQGFGQNYNAGAVFKPAHYEVAERMLQDGTRAYVPVMLKYSSVVLSDDLASRFPKLDALRTEMRTKAVDEFVFDSGTKVGAPSEQVNLPSAINYDDNRINIDPKSVVALSNENYRLQLNPSGEAYDKVSNPTQLGYFLNVMHNLTDGGKINLANADRVYSAIGEKISRGIDKLSETALDAGGRFKASVIKKSLTGSGNERLQDMLASGLDYNMPNIADKALIQMANTIDTETVKIKFPGGKMVLQSSYGIDIPDGKGGQRRLEYQQDSNGRWHAEVLLPKVYMDKAKPGDFLLPDGMGFRIPSTELHSSVPFKVAGFYDDKGSNVVVAPAELVAQHGSDFDVDSLSVIVRENASSTAWEHDAQTDADSIITAGTPVGYYKNEDGKYEFNPGRFRNHIMQQKVLGADNKPLLAKLEKLHDQLLTNQITEAFLDTISHPENKDRMLTPISTDVISDSLKELGIKGEQRINLSRLLDNLQVYNSNFQGASLVGTFANGMKSLSYISRAGKDGTYPELKISTKDTKGLEVNWNGHVYDKFTEQDHTGGNLWEELDALVNTSVDNVKEQKLYLMNATDRTGAAYVAAKAIGMPLTEAMQMMLQPVVKRFSETQGGRKTAMDNLKRVITDHARKLDIVSEGQTYTDLKLILKDKMPELTNTNLRRRIGTSSLGETPEEVAHQVAVLDQFEKIDKIGQDLSTFSSAISILQNMPVFYEDVSRKIEQWSQIGDIANGQLQTSSDFSFNLDNLMNAQPNIAEAYKAFQFMKQAADTSLIKHFPEVQALANEMAGSMKIRLLSDDNANREKIKNEITSYLLSSYYSTELKDQDPVTVDRKKGGQTILTGKQAWSQEFAEQIEQTVKEDKKTNPFLKRLSVKKDNYGIKTIQFANSSNPDPEEAMEMQEGFSAIKNEAIKNGLLKYGVLNFGLSFGARNYSMFIPSELLKPVSDYISSDMKRMVKSSTIDKDGQLTAGPLKNIRDNLAIKLAVNNPDKLPYISAKKIPPVQTLGEDGKPKTVIIGDQTVNVLSGYDGTYFWHRSYDNPIKGDTGKLVYGENDLPEFIKQRDGNGRDVVYRRLNDPTVDEKVFYQRVGYKNYNGGYDATHEVINEGYNPDDYFAKGTIPVPVADIRTGEYEARNEYIKEGSRVVVYPFSNATREQGVSGIVDKVRTSLGDDERVIFNLRRESAPDRAAEQQRMMDIAHNIAGKFGLDLGTSRELPKGVKGMIDSKTGVILMNPELMTPDTIFHEVSHPLVAAIQKQNPAWYQSLTGELNDSSEGRTILRKVQAKYPELTKEGQETEALVTAIGQEAANRLPESNFRTLVRRLMRTVGNMVRSVINEIRGKGGLSLEHLASEDMAKLSIGDIADILAAKDIKLNLKLNELGSEPQYSKELEDEKPQKDSIMESILARQESIGDPVKDTNGQEGDSYTVEGKDLLRVSKLLDKFTFRDKTTPLGPDGKPMSAVDAIARRDADRMFKNVAPGSKLIIDGVEQTKQEYEDSKRKIQLQARIKGDIIHAKIERYMAVLHGDTAKVSELDHKIEELSSQADKLPSAYDWVTRKGIFSKIMENAGINIGSKIPKGQEDKMYSEVKIASPLIGAGKIDRLVEKPDGRLRIVDWKTGSRLKDKYSATILKYGVQENRITDNPLDRAKLQVMTYALMIKAEHPAAKFDGLVVMHLPNEYEATQARNALAVEVPDYLNMLEQYYRHEEPETYSKLIQQSPRLFDPREYNAPLNREFSQDHLNNNGASEAETLEKDRLNLQKLIIGVEMRKTENASDGWTKDELRLREQLVKKIQQANSYINTDFTGALDSKYEISMMNRWLGALNDTHNPYVQSFAQHLTVNKDKADKEIALKMRTFRNLLKPVIEEKLGKRGLLQKSLKWIDQEQLFKPLWNEVRTKDPETGTEYLRRGLLTEQDKEKWAALTPAQQKLSTYMRSEMKDIFDEVMVSGNQAIVGSRENGQPMTKLDLYNKSRRGANFKYEPDFVPRVAITQEEVAQQALKQGLPGVGNLVKDQFLRKFTDFFENNMEGYNQKDYGLPVRFLGNGNTYVSPESYSMNLELGFERYMEQMIRKKHLDGTYMYGQAVKGILENANDAEGNPAFKQTAGFLDYHMKNILIGDRLMKGEGKLTRHGLAVTRKDGKEYTVSTLKTYRTLKGGVAGATLWLQPARSFVNAIQATYMNAKESGVNSLGRLTGLRASEQDLSIKTHYNSYGEAMESQWAAITGKGNSNFVHALAKELRLYTDIDEQGGKKKEYLTRGATLMDTHNFGFMYSVPEEVTNVQFGLNYLKNLQVQTGKYAGKTMYDMYKTSFNKETGTFDLPKDFKRGVIEKADGSFEDLSGLHALEIQKIHRGIQKIKGGYRPDEKVAVQGTILGDMMMMFKRWIPAMAINQYKSKFTDPSIGQFELDKLGNELRQKDGEPVYQWRARIIEGRARVVGNMLLHLMNRNKYSGYAWSDLSGEQKKSVLDFAISSATWMTMLGFGGYATGDRKENDSLRKLSENLTGRFFEQWSGLTMLDAAIQPPAVLKRADDVIGAMAKLVTAGYHSATDGQESNIYTERGDIKGMNALMKNIPLLSGYYESKRFNDDTEEGSVWSAVSPF